MWRSKYKKCRVMAVLGKLICIDTHIDIEDNILVFVKFMISNWMGHTNKFLSVNFQLEEEILGRSVNENRKKLQTHNANIWNLSFIWILIRQIEWKCKYVHI